MRHSRLIEFAVLLCVLTAGIVYVARRTAYCFGLSYAGMTALFVLLFISVIAILSSNIYVKGLTLTKHWLTIYGCYVGGFLLYLLMVTLLVNLIGFIAGISVLWQGIVTYGVTLAVYGWSIFATEHIKTPHIQIKLGNRTFALSGRLSSGTVTQGDALGYEQVALSGRRGQEEEIADYERRGQEEEVADYERRGQEEQGIDCGVRIAHLSDMHIGHFRGKRWVERVVGLVNREKPDVVVITGDIYESFYNLSTDVIEPLRELQAPVYFVTGNHDGYVNIPRIKSMLTEIGVKVLDDSLAECKGVQFVGVAYNSTPEIAMRHVDIDFNKSVVMLYHYPGGVETGVDLVLAGHTHGGQFFPVTLINHYAFKYNSGLNKYKDTYIYTSDGVGTTGPPLRFGTFAEIPIIELK